MEEKDNQQFSEGEALSGGYYDKKSNKGADFFAGVAVDLGAFFAFLMIYAVLTSVFSMMISLLIVALLFLLCVGLVYRSGRTFIAFGMIAGILLVLLLFGSCIGMLAG